MNKENLPKNSLQEYMLTHFDWLAEKLDIIGRQNEGILTNNPFNDLVNGKYNK